MGESTRLIDLYGHSLSVIYKDKYNLIILFAAEHYGKLVITVPAECMLYHTRLKRNKQYHLQVELRGHTRVIPFGKAYTKNSLVVRKAEAE